MTKSLKARLKSGEAVHGLLSPNVEATTLETLGLVGFSLYILDTEHGPAGPREAEDAARACEIAGMSLLVRPREPRPEAHPPVPRRGSDGNHAARPARDGRGAPPRRGRQVPAEGPAGHRGRPREPLDARPREDRGLRRARQRRDSRPPADRDARGLREARRARPRARRGRLHHRARATSRWRWATPAAPRDRRSRRRSTTSRRPSSTAGLLVGTVAPTGARAKELMAKGHRILLHSVTALLKNGAAAYFGAAG